MGTSAQSASCSPPGSNNELQRHGGTEKEQLCAPGDSPVPAAKRTPLVLFIDSGGTRSEWHTDVVTAGSVPGTGPAAGCCEERGMLWGVLVSASYAELGNQPEREVCFEMKRNSILAMGMSVAKPQASCQHLPCPRFPPLVPR